MLNWNATKSNLNIFTERLSLRLIRQNDVDDIWPFVSDPTISHFMSWSPHVSIDETADFIANVLDAFHQQQSITWSIQHNEQTVGIISIISIKSSHRALTFDSGELAYWLAPFLQKQGIMTEAGKAVLDFAFNHLGLHRLTVAHDVDNKASQGLIKKLNFRFLYQEYQSFRKGNRWINTNYYELLNQEYQEQCKDSKNRRELNHEV